MTVPVKREQPGKNKLKPVVLKTEVTLIEAEMPDDEEEEMIEPPPEVVFVECADGTESYYEEDQIQKKPRVPKEKTKEFVRKEMEKLCATLDELIDYDDHDFVVNFVLDMSGQAKKKTWEIQGILNH